MKTFDSEQHVYDVAGIRLPGATDVIKSAGLVDTAWMTDDARWRGKCVHRGIELLVKSELDWTTVDEAIIGYLRSFEAFLEVSRFKIEGAERPCFSVNFAAMPDLWGWLNGEPVIVELKTGAVPAWAALQTALQAKALEEETGFKATKRFGLRLTPDGSISRLREFADSRDARVAMALVDVFWWRKETGSGPKEWR